MSTATQREPHLVSFGKLVSALRKEHVNIDYVAWTQEKLAIEAGLTEYIVGNIERGDKKVLEPETLMRLAKALGLTSSERKKFFAAASGIHAETIMKDEEWPHPSESIKEMLFYLGNVYAPAFLMDSFGDVIAINRACGILFGDKDWQIFRQSSEISETNFNLLTLIFAPEYEEQRKNIARAMQDLEHHLYSSIALFRALTFENRADPYFSTILEKMLRRYPELRLRWNYVATWARKHAGDHSVDKIYLHMEHPIYGTVCQVACSTTAVTAVGELRLFVFAPIDHATHQAFTDVLATPLARHVTNFSPNWPIR